MNLREKLLAKNVFNLVKTCEPIQNRQCLVSQFAVSTGTRIQAKLGHTMPDGLIVDSDFKENYRT